VTVLSRKERAVLLVEDDLDLRDAMADVLVDAGFRVAVAGNGVEALTYLRSTSERPAVIVLDLMMPVMDGWEFRAEQLGDPALKEIPVIVLSAHGGHNDLGGATQITKPVAMAVLIAVIEQHCGRRLGGVPPP
jgi:CheY-like chemotaxis protein